MQTLDIVPSNRVKTHSQEFLGWSIIKHTDKSMHVLMEDGTWAPVDDNPTPRRFGTWLEAEIFAKEKKMFHTVFILPMRRTAV